MRPGRATDDRFEARIEDSEHGRVPRELRRRPLREIAGGLFGERGYEGASMDELCRRAGVTKPVVYELFGSKDGLFRCSDVHLAVPAAHSRVRRCGMHDGGPAGGGAGEAA